MTQKIKYMSENYIYCNKNNFSDAFFNFNKKKKKKFFIPRDKDLQPISGAIKTGIVCLDCF